MQYELFFINITANYYVHFDAVLIAVALLLFHVIVLNDHLDRSEYSTKYYRMFSNVEFPDISRDEWSFQTALFFEMGVTSQSRLLTLSIYYLQSLFTTSFALKFDV